MYPCNRTPAILPALCLLSALFVNGCGGGGSGETAPPPPPPPPTANVSLSIPEDVTDIKEWKDDTSVEVTVTLSEAVNSVVRVTLQSTGSATLDGDFALSETQVSVAQGATTGTTHITPIRDFEEEGEETITVEIGSITGDGQSGATNSVSLAIDDLGGVFGDVKDSLYSKMYVFFGDPTIRSDRVEISPTVLNYGAAATSEVNISLRVFRQASLTNLVWSNSGSIPPIMPGYSLRPFFSVPFDDLPGAGSYYAVISADTPEEEAPGARRPQDFGGLIIEPSGNVRLTCPDFGRSSSTGSEDPLLAEQWNLENTGQFSYAKNQGVEGEDLRMTQTLEDGPTGVGVKVAVADTGMETCHPDLKANVEPGASYNFNVPYWTGSLATDPFLPSVYGDHGTSVAGIIAAEADNGIGGRGVAPSAMIRGYNMLSEVGNGGYFASLGASANRPNSSDVDIFNMSFGVLGGAYNVSQAEINLYRTGVSNLRSGSGAIYVKSAGNGFRRCSSILRNEEVEIDSEDPDMDGMVTSVYLNVNINAEIGCVSSTSGPTQNLPYLIPVGAFSAHGERSSYASAGSNVWISAPSGEYGFDFPAQITTDQMGGEQGYDAFYNGLSVGAAIPVGSTENPLGDYINSFNGTSAAAPNAVGAIALLLEVQPNLTWRDVKHILARTARQIHPDIGEVKIAFGGNPTVLRHGWITNAAGYNFHNWYGFGAIAVDDAIELARSHMPDSLGTFSDGEHIFETSQVSDIPDHDGAGVTQTMTVSGIDSELKVEAVQLHIEVSHPFTNDLGIYLVSPSGTESLLNPPFNEVLTANEDLDWTLLSNAFYGESPSGEWTLKVADVAADDTGTLDAWKLTFYLGDVPARE